MNRNQVFALTVVGGPQTEVFPHWMRHHLLNFKIIPENILVGFHENDQYPAKNERWKEIFREFDIKPVHHMKGEWTSNMQTELFSKLHDVANKSDGWSTRSDCDELLEFTHGNFDIMEMIDELQRLGHTHVRGITCDRIASDGKFLSITQDKTLFDQFPIALFEYARLKTLARITRGIPNPVKRADRPEGSGIALHKNRIPITKSVHNLDNPNDPIISEYMNFAILHHFKYDIEFIDKHREFGKKVGKLYGHPDITSILEVFYDHKADALSLVKLREVYEKQESPKRWVENPIFPSKQYHPRWV